jgi:hypothetical protein
VKLKVEISITETEPERRFSQELTTKDPLDKLDLDAMTEVLENAIGWLEEGLGSRV